MIKSFLDNNYNVYSKYFMSEFYAYLDTCGYLYSLEEIDRTIINEIIPKYYIQYFYKVHCNDKRLIRNPELAIEYNIIINTLFAECVYLALFKNTHLGYLQKKTFFETLIQEISSFIENDGLGNMPKPEAIISIIEHLDLKYNELVDSQKLDGYRVKISDEHNVRNYLVSHLSSKFNHKEILKNLRQKYDKYCPNYNFALSIIMILLFVSFWILHLNIALLILTTIANLFILIYFIFINYKIDEVVTTFTKCNDIMSKYNRFGVDTISVHVSDNIISIVDPSQDNKMFPIVSDLRLELIDKLGFVLPPIRLLDNNETKNTITFKIRGIPVVDVYYEEGKNIIYKEDAERYYIDIPKDIKSHKYKTKEYYLVDESFCDNLANNTYFTDYEFFKFILKDISLNNIDRIYTVDEAFAVTEMIKTMRKNNKSKLFDYLDLYEIRDIFSKILQNGGSLKDILLVERKIIRELKHTKALDYIALVVCKELEKNQ